MTITIRKLHLAVAIVAVALLVPATAVATHIFTDVPDGAFYADPVEWAFNNEITTGTSATTFEPTRGVTRGEAVTFLKRYDDNIIQPAMADLSSDVATNTTGVATNSAGIAALDTAMPFAATAFESTAAFLTGIPTAYVTVSVTAPADGHVTLNSTAFVGTAVDGGDVLCAIFEAAAIPANLDGNTESVQWFEGYMLANNGALSGTRTFAITGQTTVNYALACEEFSDGGTIAARNLTAIFTPAP